MFVKHSNVTKLLKTMLSRVRMQMFQFMMTLEITDQARRMIGGMKERETNTETMITGKEKEMITETEETEMIESVIDTEMIETSIVMKEILVTDTIEMTEDKRKSKVILINLMNRRRSSKEDSAMRTR